MANKSLRYVHETALAAAEQAALAAYAEHGDTGACGFGWVEVQVDGRSPTARELRNLGWGKSWLPKTLQLWRPSQIGVQSIHVQEVGAQAYAETFNDLVPLGYDIKAYPCSRYD